MNESLEAYLNHETEIEKEQRLTHRFVQDHPNAVENEPDSNLRFSSSYFFKNKDIYISKHNRYAAYPKHSHDFLELNFMYAGTCTQIIDGQKIVLKKHDILLIDIGSEHSIEPLGEHDILINILFQNKNINLSWLEQIKSTHSLLFDFLLNTRQQNQIRYLLFQNNTKKIITVLQQLLEEYFFEEDFSEVIISHYLIILLTELMRKYQPDMVANPEHLQNSLLTDIFRIIETDYPTLTLSSLAKRLNYNKNYLSNLIKSETNQTFTELLNRQKLLRAHLLISSTRRSIADIVTEIGYSNRNYFYQEYKKVYHELPTVTRQKSVEII